MRLMHRVTITGGGSLEPLPAFFTHKGGDRVNVETGRIGYEERAVVLVELPEQALGPITADPRSYRVTFRGLEYTVTGVQPRYLPNGRLHHTTLELERRIG